MSLIASYPFTDLSLVQGLQGDGHNIAGASYPNGIPGVLTIENGMLRTYLTDTQALDVDRHRTEIYLTADAIGEVWYAWEFMLPSQYWADYTGGALTIAQMHDSPAIGVPTRQPNFFLQVMNGVLYTVWPRATLPAENTTFDRFAAINIQWDRWYSVCVRVNWQITTAGFREVFIDRVPVFRQWNVATGYDDVLQPYFKIGIYNTSGGLSGDKVAYFRNLTRWTGNDGYQAVMGGVPVLPPRILGI